MPYLESLDELDIFKVIGLIEICKENRDYIQGYALCSKADFYRISRDLLNKKIKIKIPNLDERYYKSTILSIFKKTIKIFISEKLKNDLKNIIYIYIYIQEWKALMMKHYFIAKMI